MIFALLFIGLISAQNVCVDPIDLLTDHIQIQGESSMLVATNIVKIELSTEILLKNAQEAVR